MDQVDTHALVALLVLGAVAQAVLAWRRRRRIRGLIDADPATRTRFYLRLAVVWSVAAALAALVVVAHPDLDAADVGWAWPRHDPEANFYAWWFSAAWVLGLLLGTLLRRARRARGAPQRPRHPIVPRSRREVPLAALTLLCTSTAEEVIYRGLFIGAGTQLYHAPLAVAAAVSLALFIAGHANQGRGMIGVGLVGLLLTLVYVNTGSLLLVVALHALHNIVAVFLIPRAASTRPAPRPAVRAPVPDDRAEVG